MRIYYNLGEFSFQINFCTYLCAYFNAIFVYSGTLTYAYRENLYHLVFFFLPFYHTASLHLLYINPSG